MTARKPLYVFGCITVVLAIAYGSTSAVQGEPQKLAADNAQNMDFTKKIVVLEITGGAGLNSESGSLVLANARVLKLGDRDFIVGDAVATQDEENDWHKDISVGAPCDNIVTLRAMTPERFKTYAKKWAEQAEE